MEAKAAGITFSVLPERERRRVKGTLELFLHSISKYLPSLSAVARGRVKDVTHPQGTKVPTSPGIAAGGLHRKSRQTGGAL